MSNLSELKVVVIRLKGSGQELVTRVERSDWDTKIRLHDPMLMTFVQGPDTMNYLRLGLWNPLSLYKERHFDIDSSEILYTSEASNPLVTYYYSVVEKWDNLVKDQPDREFAHVRTLTDLISDLEKQDETEESLSRDTKKDSDKDKMN